MDLALISAECDGLLDELTMTQRALLAEDLVENVFGELMVDVPAQFEDCIGDIAGMLIAALRRAARQPKTGRALNKLSESCGATEAKPAVPADKDAA